MTKILTAQVGANAVLSLNVPMDRADANKTVRVIVETVEPQTGSLPMDRETWLRFIERTAGSIADPTFARHPQGECEERDSLP
jgi:hypothetical protein